MSAGEQMNILVSVDDGYVMPLCVMLTSLLETNRERAVHVWFLRGGVSDEGLGAVEEAVAQRGGGFTALTADPGFFEGYNTAGYITRETYLRLLCGEVLPAQVHRALWLDADAVVCGDLAGFYNMDLGGCALAACSHAAGMSRDMPGHCREIDVEPDAYVNAGVLLIDVDAWRAEGMRAQVQRVHERFGKLKYADQDMVNIIFKGRIAQADPWRFNFRTNCEYDDAALERARADARIVHYCGTMKPWMFSDIPLGDVWRDWHAASPFAGRPLRLISRVGLSRLAQRAKKRAGQ